MDGAPEVMKKSRKNPANMKRINFCFDGINITKFSTDVGAFGSSRKKMKTDEKRTRLLSLIVHFLS